MNRIKELRRKFGYSQDALGKLLNCTGVSVSRYESGKSGLDMPTVNRLCDIFNCSADYLLCRTDEPLGALSTDPAERRAALYQDIYDLTPEEKAMVDAFVAGLRASRKNK